MILFHTDPSVLKVGPELEAVVAWSLKSFFAATSPKTTTAATRAARARNTKTVLRVKDFHLVPRCSGSRTATARTTELGS
jgi:hypothetical protein